MSAGFDIVLLSVCQNALMWNLSSLAGEQLPHLPLAPSSGLSQPLGWWWWWWCNIANWMLLTKKNFLQPSSPPIVSQNCRVLVLPLSLTALELYNEQVRRHLLSLLVLSHVPLSNMGICLLSLIFFTLEDSRVLWCCSIQGFRWNCRLLHEFLHSVFVCLKPGGHPCSSSRRIVGERVKKHFKQFQIWVSEKGCA